MNLRQIDLNLLVSLDMLLAERNVTRAAQRLSISQSALSTQLAQLRRLFDDPLLIPQARGVLPTARALELERPLKQVLGELEALLRQSSRFDPATAGLTFRIGSTDAILHVLGLPLVLRLREAAPRLRIALTQPAREIADRQLESADLDLFLATPQNLSPQWKARQVLIERMVCVLRRDHPAAARPLDLDTFCSLDHLLVSPTGGGFSGSVDEVLAGLGRRRRVAVSVQGFLLAPRVLEASDLVATLPERISRSFPQTLAVIDPPCEIPGFTVHMAWHPRVQKDPAHVWLREQVLSLGDSI